MMMGRRIRLRGPIRPLSPTEGKFGLKGGARSGGGWRYFCTGMPLKAMKPGLFGFPEVFQQASNFFSLPNLPGNLLGNLLGNPLGRTVVITDNAFS